MNDIKICAKEIIEDQYKYNLYLSKSMTLLLISIVSSKIFIFTIIGK